jgi:peptidoglycan/LPS O-acetylase OafA/YrhL
MSEFTKRRIDFDIARFFAAFAVVTHHISQYSSRYHIGTFSPKFGDSLVEIVSFIHIPTFMLISGMLTSASETRVHGLNDYFRFEGKKFCRLMLPFLSISMLHLAIKAVTPTEVLSKGTTALANTLLTPNSGAAGHLWFLYCLMSIFLIWPLLNPLVSGKTYAILFSVLLALAILPIHWPLAQNGQSLFGLSSLFWYLPIFMIGCCYHPRSHDVHKYALQGIVIAGFVLTASILIHFFVSWPQDFLFLAIRNAIRMAGLISAAFFVLWLSGIISKHTNLLTKSLIIAGFYSYDIYLLHVALAGHPLCYAISKLHPGNITTYALFVALIFATMIIPMGIGWLIRRVPSLAFVMLGVPMRKRNI